jgi:hypothetical protein
MNPLARIYTGAGFKTAALAAKACYVSRVHMLNLGRGRNGASDELIARMAKAFSCTETDIRDAIKLAQKRLYKRSLTALK